MAKHKNQEKHLIRNSTAEFLIFTGQAGEQSIETRYEDETIWLSQKLMAALFDVGINTINYHLKEIFESGEIQPDSTIRKIRIVQTEGSRQVTRSVDHYNLDMIIAIGYRVRSPRGVQFRQWATERLREYLVKGFTLDDERLKGTSGLVDHFDELLARIRDIRASEARVYQRIREIFALGHCNSERIRTTTILEVAIFFFLITSGLHKKYP